MSQPAPARNPMSLVFLAHIALETPLIIQGFWAPATLPFLGMTNTTLVVVKLLACISLGSCITSLLCYGLPEYLPGKRALAIGFTVYHSAASTVLFQAPRFIPSSLGPLFEQNNVTWEIVWGTLHGLLSLIFVFWWQATLSQTAAIKKMQ